MEGIGHLKIEIFNRLNYFQQNIQSLTNKDDKVSQGTLSNPIEIRTYTKPKLQQGMKNRQRNGFPSLKIETNS